MKGFIYNKDKYRKGSGIEIVDTFLIHLETFIYAISF